MLELRKLAGLRLLDARVERMKEFGDGLITSHYREGNPEKQVIRLAEELDAGLIVTGGQRRPWFERIFGTGFSEAISRRASRPLLVVDERGLRGSAVPR